MKEILAPEFLVERISLISTVLSGVALVIFSDLVLRRVVFPVTEFVRGKTHQTIKKSRLPVVPAFFAELAAAVVFIIYCYIGTGFLSEYILFPLLFKMRGFILPIVIILLLIISYVINNKGIRKKFMKV